MALFAVTIFLSATLLFLVQPMMGKMLLPLAGGSSAVWNTCMVTFQAALLGGYLYSHLVTNKLKLKWQVTVHGLLAFFAFAACFADSPTAPPSTDSTVGLTLWLVWSIVATVGLPFFVVSTTGPLIQRWFSRTDHPRASDPYFLYAASNIGSSLGLLGYPFLLESQFTIAEQRLLWAGLFLVLAILLIVCGVSSIKSESSPDFAPAPEVKAAPPSWRRRAYWVALAAVPSSFMIGVTQHISTDLAAVPLLWVIPLFLYLMTFTVAFSPRIPLSAKWLGWILVALTLLDGFVVMTGLNTPFNMILALHISTFTVGALMCHRRLADDRPAPSLLTEFYFFIALGGVLGGIFNALVAPVAFNLVYEYPIAMAACILMRPWTRTTPIAVETEIGITRLRARLSLWSEGSRGVALALAFAAVLPLGMWVLGKVLASNNTAGGSIDTARCIAALAACGALALLIRRPLLSALPFVTVAMFGQYFSKITWGDEHLTIRRSFFGVHHVFSLAARRDGEIDRTKPVVHKLHHGTTLHGAQLFGPVQRRRPDGVDFMMDASTFATTYYHPKGPVGDIMRHMANTPARRESLMSMTAGVVSLANAGALAEHSAPTLPLLSAGSLAAWPAIAQNLGAQARASAPVSRVAVIGLGSGGMASWSQPGDHYTFYEIDPVVRDIALDTRLFTYVSDARARGATVDIVIGDGRIKIAEAPDKSFGMIILDAFSSDSIPVHLLTREAVELYLRKITDDGIVAFHISNRYFDLRPVLARHAADLKEHAYLGDTRIMADDNEPRGLTPSRSAAEYMAPSTWVVFGSAPAVQNFKADNPWWIPLLLTREREKTAPTWTDDFSDVLAVFRGAGKSH